ncbi:MAG: flavodoxin [Clostridia bacterium]|nr:flavodoxin [Clostridia bacterium]
MTIAVCYFSKSGNTRKVTEAVGDAIGVKARDLSWPFDRKMDVVFLGSGVYAGGVDEQVKNFLKRNAGKIGVLVNVSTGAFGSSYKAVKKLATELGIEVADAEYHCKGKFAIFNGSHPNAADLEAAAEFGKKFMADYEASHK